MSEKKYVLTEEQIERIYDEGRQPRRKLKDILSTILTVQAPMMTSNSEKMRDAVERGAFNAVNHLDGVRGVEALRYFIQEEFNRHNLGTFEAKQ